MNYRDYYKQISSVVDSMMEGEIKKTENKTKKGFIPKPRDTSEEVGEQNPLEIVAEYMVFFRQDAIKGLEEVGVNADFIKGSIVKSSKEE